MMNEEVAKILLKSKAVTLSPKKPYTYASGILSPIYCDNRILMSYPEEREKIVSYFLKSIKKNKIRFDIVAGTATAGIPWAAWLAYKLKKPMVYIRKDAKDHGKQNSIEGKLDKGKKVLVVEDLISTGGSSINAVNAVRNSGGVVNHCIAIFTYQMKKADESFKESRCKLLTLSDFKTLVDVASGSGYIKKQDKEIVLSWSKDPENWGK